MNDEDKQEMEMLKMQLSHLHMKCHEQDHQLMTLQVHTVRQEALVDRLLHLVGLLPEDIKNQDALTSKDKSFLLRMRRTDN
jgi:hypothetical protein